jgi:Arc/MetJ family transcription regulator
MATITIRCVYCSAPVSVDCDDAVEAQEIRDAQTHGECEYYCDACMPGPNQEVA